MFSDPVVGEKFFGRGETLDLLTRRAQGLKEGFRQNIAVIGPRLIGKSSLLLQFLSNFSHPQVVPIYIDLRLNSLSHFIQKFIGTLLYHYLKAKNIKSDEQIESLKNQAQATIPQTVETIRRIEKYMQNLQFALAYETALQLTAVLKKESAFNCMLILDEFHL
ncbi:MAG: ATP-binding protein, partial [Candidatus Omnitrophica bacterium]|nr:ATP-binding protein [Candidatus Omnitrophota bacterium]